MRHIIADKTSLIQYSIKEIFERPGRCHRCGSCRLHRHGCYGRKSDRCGSGKLNPVLIQRYRCGVCGTTCSVLPECIPPHRWYLWKIQQAVLILVLAGKSYRAIAKEVLPSRSTISRWVGKFKEQFRLYADCLKSFCAELGSYGGFEAFWKAVLRHWDLSRIMLNLNNMGVIIP